ncbi:acetolactate synthase, partial [Helicobacter pylori]|uniref:SAM hydroxide adenosyltransferase n=1 Tax=Helicobacter pylori TaxID=210 RepID=UPI00196B9390
KRQDILCVTISKGSKKKYEGKMPYVASFGDVLKGQPLVYLNSLLNVSVALNRDNFAQKYQIKSGADWNIDIKKCTK